jgi:lactate 2-monooxygenase
MNPYLDLMNSSALEWQKQIYLDGFAGKRLKTKVDFSRLETQARKAMSEKAFAYIAGGAGNESTMARNMSAFSQYAIVPRMLRDVSHRDTRVRLFGNDLPSPFLLAPIGVLEIVHPDADLGVAKAAAQLNIPFIFSNQASVPMEQCAHVMKGSPRWFQLYWSKSRALVESFVQRAESCGCRAIVVTLDTTMLGWRSRDLNLSYLPFLEGMGIAQYTSDPVFQKMLDEPDAGPVMKKNVTLRSIRGFFAMVNRYPGPGFYRKLSSGRAVKAVQRFIATYSNPGTMWEDLAFLRSATRLPVLLKGILHEDDARKALDCGIDGIIVSNHGGRQVDGAVSTLEVLPGIVKTVNGRVPVLLDSGIRSGADAFKAIALGATAVCIGRPYAYGLAVAGSRGVYEVMRNYMAEFELTMGLSGCRSVSDIHHSVLRRS